MNDDAHTTRIYNDCHGAPILTPNMFFLMR